MIRYKIDFFTEKNQKSDDKPNEDIAFFDENLNIGVILDGVSRDREGGAYPNPSPALEAGKLFSKTIMDIGQSSGKRGLEKISEMITSGNKILGDYNRKLQHRFPAGVVGLVFSFEENNLYYGYIGDCYGKIIRDGMIGTFTECQTAMIMKHKKEYTSDEIRFSICNHINHLCGYGVWDGNVDAMDFVKYGIIRIAEGDVLLLHTDGMLDDFNQCTVEELAGKSFEEIASMHQNNNQDDKTCLRLTAIT